MNSVFSFVVALLTAALSLLGFVQQHPELPQASRDQAQQVAQQVITQATQALSNSAPAAQNKNVKTTSATSVAVNALAPLPTFTAPSDWKTYSNPTYRFQIRYPGMILQGIPNTPTENQPTTFTGKTFRLLVRIPTGSGTVFVMQIDEGKTIQDRLNDRKMYPPLQTKEIVVAGEKGLQFIADTGEGGIARTVLWTRGNLLFEVSLGTDDRNDPDRLLKMQMLSTFKFTDSI